MQFKPLIYSIFLTATTLFVVTGCEKGDVDGSASARSNGDSSPGVATLYCSVDEAFARKVIAAYEKKTGASVQLITDTEAGKTTSLVQKLRLERDRPRADVLWSSEQSQTELLAREGVLAAYDSPSAADIPGQFRHPENLWTGFALRARVVAYDPARTSADELPKTWRELEQPQFAGSLAMANPLFGTTRGHVAAMQVGWGADELRAFLESLVAQKTLITDGNSTAVRKLISGDVKFAMTDSDDVLVAQKRGHQLAMTYPDMGDGGTMLIPNTVALVAGSPHPDAGRRLIDYILSADVERMLAESDSGNYPVRESLRRELKIELPPASKISIGEIVDAQPAAIQLCRDVLLR